MSNSSLPHGLQPIRLLCPWDFPGKGTGVGCHCLLHWWWAHTHDLEQPVLLSASTTAQDRSQDTAKETPSHIQVTPTQYRHHFSPLGKSGRHESEEGNGVVQPEPQSSRSHRIFTTPGTSVNCWSFLWGLNLQVKQNQKPKYLDCELSVCKDLTHVPLWLPVIDTGKPPWFQNGHGGKESLVSIREVLKYKAHERNMVCFYFQVQALKKKQRSIAEWKPVQTCLLLTYLHVTHLAHFTSLKYKRRSESLFIFKSNYSGSRNWFNLFGGQLGKAAPQIWNVLPFELKNSPSRNPSYIKI